MALVSTVRSDATAGMIAADVESQVSSAIASRASASLSYTLRFLDRKNAMRLSVTEAHEPRSSSYAASVRDCRSTPPNCGGRSREAPKCRRS